METVSRSAVLGAATSCVHTPVSSPEGSQASGREQALLSDVLNTHQELEPNSIFLKPGFSTFYYLFHFIISLDQIYCFLVSYKHNIYLPKGKKKKKSTNSCGVHWHWKYNTQKRCLLYESHLGCFHLCHKSQALVKFKGRIF